MFIFESKSLSPNSKLIYFNSYLKNEVSYEFLKKKFDLVSKDKSQPIIQDSRLNIVISNQHLGKGGLGKGEVFKGTINGQDCAIKKIKKDHLSKEDFFSEVETLLKVIANPHSTQIFDFYEEEDSWIIVMSIIPGKHITSDMISSLSIEQLRQYETWGSYCWSQGISPRDINIGNFTIDTNGILYFLDYGLYQHIEKEEIYKGILMLEGLIDMTEAIVSQISNSSDEYSQVKSVNNFNLKQWIRDIVSTDRQRIKKFNTDRDKWNHFLQNLMSFYNNVKVIFHIDSNEDLLILNSLEVLIYSVDQSLNYEEVGNAFEQHIDQLLPDLLEIKNTETPKTTEDPLNTEKEHLNQQDPNNVLMHDEMSTDTDSLKTSETHLEYKQIPENISKSHIQWHKVISDGSSFTIYETNHIGIVAKVAKDEASTILLSKESEHLKKMYHPHWSRIQEDSPHIMYIPKIEGITWKEFKKKHSKSEQKDTLIEIISTIKSLHKRGLIHGDLSDDNILIEEKSKKFKIFLIDPMPSKFNKFSYEEVLPYEKKLLSLEESDYLDDIEKGEYLLNPTHLMLGLSYKEKARLTQDQKTILLGDFKKWQTEVNKIIQLDQDIEMKVIHFLEGNSESLVYNVYNDELGKATIYLDERVYHAINEMPVEQRDELRKIILENEIRQIAMKNEAYLRKQPLKSQKIEGEKMNDLDYLEAISFIQTMFSQGIENFDLRKKLFEKFLEKIIIGESVEAQKERNAFDKIKKYLDLVSLTLGHTNFYQIKNFHQAKDKLESVIYEIEELDDQTIQSRQNVLNEMKNAISVLTAA